MIRELWDVYKKSEVPGIDQFGPDRAVLSFAMPYHEGAVRYYKEIGIWKAENQKNNDQLFKRQQVLSQAWVNALSQAAEKKVKSKEFSKLWRGIRIKSLEDAGIAVHYTNVE